MDNFWSKWIVIEDYFRLLEEFDTSEISLFHTKKWLICIKDSFALELKAIATYKNDELYSLTPFSFLRRGIFLFVGSPLKGTFTQEGGPLFKTKIDNYSKIKVLESIESKLNKFSFYIEWSPNISNKLIHDFINYSTQKSETSIIDLGFEEELLWGKMESRARNMIRKSIKSGLIANRREISETWIKAFYTILVGVYKKQKRKPPHGYNFYQNLVKLENDKILCIDIVKNNKIIAGAIFLKNKNSLIFLSGASNKEANKLCGPSLIQWNAIKYAREKSFRYYDMGGLGVASIDKFKKSFGGVTISKFKLLRTNFIYKMIEPLIKIIKKYFL